MHMVRIPDMPLQEVDPNCLLVTVSKASLTESLYERRLAHPSVPHYYHLHTKVWAAYGLTNQFNCRLSAMGSVVCSLVM